MIIPLALYVVALVLGTMLAKKLTGIDGGLPALLLSWLVGAGLMVAMHLSKWCPITPDNAAWFVLLTFATNGGYKLRRKVGEAVAWLSGLIKEWRGVWMG